MAVVRQLTGQTIFSEGIDPETHFAFDTDVLTFWENNEAGSRYVVEIIAKLEESGKKERTYELTIFEKDYRELAELLGLRAHLNYNKQNIICMLNYSLEDSLEDFHRHVRIITKHGASVRIVNSGSGYKVEDIGFPSDGDYMIREELNKP
jgi:hypothetical protein